MGPRWRWGVVAMLALAACSSSSAKATSTTRARTVGEFASAVSVARADFAQIENDRTTGCSEIDLDNLCDALARVVEFDGKEFVRAYDLDRALRALGSPPAAIAELVRTTEQRMSTIYRTGKAWTTCVQASGGAAQCDPQSEAFIASKRALDTTWAAWSPYL